MKVSISVHSLTAFGALIACLALTACGGTNTGYTDPQFHYSFNFPSGWSATNKASVQGPYYALIFTNPLGVQIAVGNPVTIPKFKSPKIVKGGLNCSDATGHATLCRYTHITVSGIRGERRQQVTLPTATQKSYLFADSVFLDTAKHSYAILLRQVKISPATDAKFGQLVKSFHVNPND